MDDLQARWAAAFQQYETLKAAAEGAVVRWEWTSGERYSLQPLFFRRYPGRGRVLEGPGENGGFRYGFDAGDRVRVFQMHNYAAEVSEEFYTYADDHVVSVRYTTFLPRLPWQVAYYTLEDERVTRYRLFNTNFGPAIRVATPDAILALAERTRMITRSTELYRYQGERLVRIQHEVETAGPPPRTFEEHLTYDEVGRLQRVEKVQPTGETYTSYRRPQKGQTLSALADEVKQRLVQAIPARLQQAQIADPVYCLVLWFREADFYVPPLPTPGLEADRQSALAAYGAEARYRLWMPAGPDLIHLEDPATVEVCDLFNQQVIATEQWDLGLTVVQEVAAALTHVDWTGILDVTDDFVIYGMDYEMHDLEEAMAASVPAGRIDDLRRRGLL